MFQILQTHDAVIKVTVFVFTLSSALYTHKKKRLTTEPNSTHKNWSFFAIEGPCRIEPRVFIALKLANLQIQGQHASPISFVEIFTNKNYFLSF